MSEKNNMNIFNLRNVISSSMYNIEQNRQSFHFPNILLSEMLLLKNKQEAVSFKISENMPYICSKKF